LVASGIANSNSDARRKIAGGGVKINDADIVDPNRTMHWSQLDTTLNAFKVKYGKKVVLVKPED
jgi:tyrosyl-tRNA synthetase